MTRSITVSLPDDIADYLERHLDPSEAVANALRPGMERAAKTRAILEAAGFRSTREGRAWARAALRPLTDEQRAETRRRRELIESGRWEEI